MNDKMIYLKLRKAGHSKPSLGLLKINFRLDNQQEVSTLDKLAVFRKLKEKGHTDPVAGLERFSGEMKKKRSILDDIAFFSDPIRLKPKKKINKD